MMFNQKKQPILSFDMLSMSNLEADQLNEEEN